MGEEILTQNNEEVKEEVKEEKKVAEKPSASEYTVAGIIRYSEPLSERENLYKTARAATIVAAITDFCAIVAEEMGKINFSEDLLSKFIVLICGLGTGLSFFAYIKNRFEYMYNKKMLEIEQTLRTGERLGKLNVDAVDYVEITHAIYDGNFAKASAILDQQEMEQNIKKTDEEAKKSIENSNGDEEQKGKQL